MVFSNETFLLMLAAAAGIGGFVIVQIVFAITRGDKDRVKARLAANRQTDDGGGQRRSIVLPKAYETTAADLFAEATAFRKLKRKLEQIWPDTSVSRFLSIIAIMAAGAFIGVAWLTQSLAAGVLTGMIVAPIPLLVLNMKHNKRQKVIDDELPDSLDFITRILRAGHSLATAFQMAGDELPDPLGTEFRRCYDQHSLGQPLEHVMKDMAQRVDVPDFAFFVTAVLIQRQTGGDLAEVLKNISGMVRQRIRLQQHVKAITAEGRLVGMILLALPIIFFCILYVLNPGYASVLLTTSEGRLLVGVGLTLQILGYFTIRKIVSVQM